LTIQDDEARPSFNFNNPTVSEPDSGTSVVDFAVRLSNATTQVVTVNYQTADGTATAGNDYQPASGTLTFQPGETEKKIAIGIIADDLDESGEDFYVDLSKAVNSELPAARGVVAISAHERAAIQFGAATYVAGEGDERATIILTRNGDMTLPARVDYNTVDDERSVRCDDNAGSSGVAFARCDYATTYDTLFFAPGERQKSFTIPLVDDRHDEPEETIELRLSDPVGVALGARSVVRLTITDNDAPDEANPLDAHAFFVRQHYLDFLSREPEMSGITAWTNVLDNCPDPANTNADSPSARCDRNLVSSSFFRSQEFELKGYFVYRFYRVAFNRRPQYSEFIPDMRRVTGQTADEVYAKRRAFGEAWMQRKEFADMYGAMGNAGFVDALLGRYNLTAINTTDPANPDGTAMVQLTRDDLVAALDAQPQRLTRAQTVRAIVQSREVDAMEYNGAFVAMQYYGYLRRTPEQSGYEAWLQVINRGDGYRVMVNGFMNSLEYRLRFGR
jgi:hypothetical protein